MADLFTIGRSTVLTAQRVMDSIQHNIANTETPGYKRYVETNQEVANRNGVTTTINRSSNIFLENKLAYAQANNEYSKSFNSGLDIVSKVTTDTLEQSYSKFMEATHNLQFNKNDPVNQVQFKLAGEEFGRQLKAYDQKLTEAKTNVTFLRDLKQVELDSLQKQMSAITAGPPTLDAKTRLTALQHQVMIATQSVEGYNKVINGVIPSIQSMYSAARDDVINGINTNYGKQLFDANDTFNFDKNNIGNVVNLTEHDSQKFNQDVGVMKTVLGSMVRSGNLQGQISNTEYEYALSAERDANGVNLVDESIKALRYQRMYEAGAKLIQIQDQMIGTLLNIRA